LQSLHAQSLAQIKNVFACSKHSNLKKRQSLIFSNVFLTLKIIDFESVVLTRVVHIYKIEGMNA
jgi:hypothetical protein